MTLSNSTQLQQSYGYVRKTSCILFITGLCNSETAQKYLESVSRSVRMIVITNLGMSIVEREPSGFRITVIQPITTV